MGLLSCKIQRLTSFGILMEKKMFKLKQENFYVHITCCIYLHVIISLLYLWHSNPFKHNLDGHVSINLCFFIQKLWIMKGERLTFVCWVDCNHISEELWDFSLKYCREMLLKPEWLHFVIWCVFQRSLYLNLKRSLNFLAWH